MSKKNKADRASALLEELKRRTTVQKVFTIEDHCFDKQIQFIRDPARFKTAVVSRRGGKSESCGHDLVNTPMSGPHNNCAYITLTRTSAKRIIWPIVKRIIKDYNIDCKFDNTELTVEFPTGSMLYLGGAKDMNECEKYRGLSLKKVYIDESQSFKESILSYLVDDVLAYATMDVNGSIHLIGTPGPLASGYFYRAAHSSSWSNHKWTIFNNPWIKLKSGKEPAELLAEERARKGIDESNATYRREALAEWVNDIDALVFKFSADKNLYSQLPTGEMQYIFGIDIGYNDADAIAVLGYSFTDKNVYLIEEVVKSKQDITSLANQVKILQEKYKPIRMVMDAGALGKKIQEEIRMRQGLVLETAEKTRKFEFIELMNDDLRNGRFKAKLGSQFEEDSYKSEWDRSNPDKLKISDRYHSDIHDAALYAWRECKHYFWTPEAPKIEYGSQAHMDAMEQEEIDRIVRARESEHGLEPTTDDIDFIYSDD